MDPQGSGREDRPVLIHTLHGAVEGRVTVNANLRTLDYLNVPHKFVTVDATEIGLSGWSFDTGIISINKELTLFAMELQNQVMMTDARVEAHHYSREAVRLRLADFDIQGYMHVRGMTDPMMRLSQNKQPFIALTSVSVVGDEAEYATSFLAVNPLHITAAQNIRQDTQIESAGPVESGAGVY